MVRENKLSLLPNSYKMDFRTELFIMSPVQRSTKSSVKPSKQNTGSPLGTMAITVSEVFNKIGCLNPESRHPSE